MRKYLPLGLIFITHFLTAQCIISELNVDPDICLADDAFYVSLNFEHENEGSNNSSDDLKSSDELF